MGSIILLLRERRCVLLLLWLLGLLSRRRLLLNRDLRRNWNPSPSSHSLVRRRSHNSTTTLDLGSRRPHPSSPSAHSTTLLLRRSHHPLLQLVCLLELLCIQDLCVDVLLLLRCRRDALGSGRHYRWCCCIHLCSCLTSRSSGGRGSGVWSGSEEMGVWNLGLGLLERRRDGGVRDRGRWCWGM